MGPMGAINRQIRSLWTSGWLGVAGSYQARTGGSATPTILLMELQISEFENKLLQWLGLRLHAYIDTHGDKQCIHRRFDSTDVAAHGNIDRFLTEKSFQHTELGAVQ